MKNNIWYEVYKSDNEGSQTLEIALTLKEARKIKKDKVKIYGHCIHIDKWKNKYNPVRIEGME